MEFFQPILWELHQIKHMFVNIATNANSVAATIKLPLLSPYLEHIHGK